MSMDDGYSEAEALDIARLAVRVHRDGGRCLNCRPDGTCPALEGAIGFLAIKAEIRAEVARATGRTAAPPNRVPAHRWA